LKTVTDLKHVFFVKEYSRGNGNNRRNPKYPPKGIGIIGIKAKRHCTFIPKKLAIMVGMAIIMVIEVKPSSQHSGCLILLRQSIHCSAQNRAVNVAIQ